MSSIVEFIQPAYCCAVCGYANAQCLAYQSRVNYSCFLFAVISGAFCCVLLHVFAASDAATSLLGSTGDATGISPADQRAAVFCQTGRETMMDRWKPIHQIPKNNPFFCRLGLRSHRIAFWHHCCSACTSHTRFYKRNLFPYRPEKR